MLKITRKFDYAMVLLTDLGIRRSSPASARQISERYHLSLSLTANVLKGLQRRSLVRSTRGVNGGYVLAKEPSEISLSEVIRAIEGERNMTHCQVSRGNREVRCPAHSVCPARGYVTLLEKRIRGLFEGSTLADVLGMAGTSAAVERAGRLAVEQGSR